VDTAIYYVSASQEIDPPVEVVKVLNVEISGDIGQVNSGNLRLFGKVISAHIFGESRDDKWTITIAIANRQGSTQTVSTSEWTLLGDRLHVSVDDLAEISTTPKDIFILPVRIRTVYIPHGKCYECMLLRTINRGEYCRVGFAQVHPNLANWKSLDFESMLNDTVPAEITIF
jgi:hypothetical protein